MNKIKPKVLETSGPPMVKLHDVTLDAEYAEWIAEVKHRYRSAQVKAAVKVNGEKLLFNWQMGRDLVQKKAEERWGAGAVEQVSLDLKREFPKEDGFSARNLRYMKQWYLYYTAEAQKLQRPVAEIMCETGIEVKTEKLQRPVAEQINQPCVNQAENAIAPQLGEQIQRDLFTIGWGHHKVLIDKCSKQPEKALFYVRQAINPTIGLLVCKEKDRVQAQYALESSSQPIGISEYELEKFYPAKVEGTIPTIKEIEEKL